MVHILEGGDSVDKPKLVFLDRATFAPHLKLEVLDITHHWQEYDNTSAEQLVERLKPAEVAIVNKVQLNLATLSRLPRLKMISLTATGFNNIDLNYCKQAGIAVCNTRNYATSSLSEHTFSLILSLARSVNQYHQSVVQGRWSSNNQFCYFDYPIRDLSGATLCIVGKGNLGNGVARLAQAFGMQVIFAGRKNDRSQVAGRVPFAQAIANAEIISLHCPLNQATTELLGAAEFALMKNKPLIVNTARGGLINSAALVAALESGQIAGAALDVLPQEPPCSDDLLVTAAAKLPNLIITPHIAWASDHGQLACWAQAIENILAWGSGDNLRRLV